jgi:membrane fusion protein (multidrug efflux system)
MPPRKAPVPPAPAHAPSDAKTEEWWKHPRAFKVLVGVAVTAFLCLLLWWFHFRPYVSSDDARVGAVMVRLAPSGAGGRVAAVDVEEGDRVAKGQVLLRLDSRQAEARLERARATAAHDELTLKRTERLAAQHGVSQASLDEARAAAQVAHAELALAQANLDDCWLKSPVDGMVVQRWTDPGAFLATGQAALAVTDVDNAWVEANVQETEVSLVKPGQPVSIDVDEGGRLSGKVKGVLNATASQFSLLPSQNSSGNFIKLVQRVPVRVELDPHPGQSLKAGESVVIKIRVR